MVIIFLQRGEERKKEHIPIITCYTEFKRSVLSKIISSTSSFAMQRHRFIEICTVLNHILNFLLCKAKAWIHGEKGAFPKLLSVLKMTPFHLQVIEIRHDFMEMLPLIQLILLLISLLMQLYICSIL
jgi:hypothetical protein